MQNKIAGFLCRKHALPEAFSDKKRVRAKQSGIVI
jgi:hypothetical protein